MDRDVFKLLTSSECYRCTGNPGNEQQLEKRHQIKSNQFYLDTAYLTNDSGVFTKKKKISETNYNHLHH